MYVIGRGRTAREAYPGRSGGFVLGELVRLYAGGAQASVPETELAAKIPELDWAVGFTQAVILPESGVAVIPGGYPIGRFSAKRVLTGAGPAVGDNPIQYNLMQSIDNGLNWTTLGPTILFNPDEIDTKIVSVSLTAPSEALLAVRGTYPTNYDPTTRLEFIWFVIEVMSAG